jgi:glycosyltransferase involved in cell wall biosynthesis
MSLNASVALVVDALTTLGGSEKVLMNALELFPHAPIYTLIYNRQIFQHTPLARRKVISSFIGQLPLAHTQYRKYLPFMPYAVQQFDLSRYETILSFSYAVAHGVNVQPGQKHYSYTYTPMRYAWRNYGLDGLPRRAKGLERLFEAFRRWDISAVKTVTQFAAVSKWIAGWVASSYNQNAYVIYPPVEVERFSPAQERSDYFITISRLVPHKRLGLIVEAFNRLGLPLLVVGEGQERRHLERHAKENIHFLGYQPDSTVNDLLNRARAFVSTSEEDFGIAMVEAQAAGCPLIAYGKGGAAEIVIEDQSGILFDQPTPDGLVEAVEKFLSAKFSSDLCSANAARFNRQRFLAELDSFVSGKETTQTASLGTPVFNAPVVGSVWPHPGVKPYPYEQQ